MAGAASTERAVVGVEILAVGWGAGNVVGGRVVVAVVVVGGGAVVVEVASVVTSSATVGAGGDIAWRWLLPHAATPTRASTIMTRFIVQPP